MRKRSLALSVSMTIDEKEMLACENIFVQKSMKNQSNDSSLTLKESFHQRTGYKITSKVTSTTQGSVYKAINENNDVIIVKRAGLDFYVKHSKYIDKNIAREAKILEYLGKMNPPKNNWIKYIDLIYDDRNVYLLMEYGGINLFQYTKLMHCKIKRNKLSINEWTKHVRILFKQMCHYIDWLHKCNITHSDICLESIVIKDFKLRNGKFMNHGYISFIDFGLAQDFRASNGDFNTQYYNTGKTMYISPELYQKRQYNSKLNDIWSLGVILFMLNFGISPYIVPSNKCKNFSCIIRGDLKKIVKPFNKTKYLSRNILKLLNNIFKTEKSRYSMKNILKQKYLK